MTQILPYFISLLNRPLTVINGIRDARLKLFQKITGGSRLIDLLLTPPVSIVDRNYRPTLKELQGERIATLNIPVSSLSENKIRGKKHYAKVTFHEGHIYLTIGLFSPWQIKTAKDNATLAISGKTIEQNAHHFIMRPIDYCLPASQIAKIPYLDPKWPLTAGLFNPQVKRAMTYVLACLPKTIKEWHRPEIIKEQKWPDFITAVKWIQNPDSVWDKTHHKDWQTARKRALQRLRCDEFLCEQLSMRLARLSTHVKKGCFINTDHTLVDQALKKFGHELTPGQQRILEEIEQELASPSKMNRLIQGDVGSGKTLIALMAMLETVSNGYQAALMVPTEILAKQHAQKCASISPVPVTLLCASIKEKEKKKAKEDIRCGHAKIIIGTQALIQRDIHFHKLGLAIIDEQHRFGVAQRLCLANKGQDVNVLGMTATPIPRTLLLTRFGHMQTSFLKDKPKGRKPILTSVHSMAQFFDVLKGLKRILKNGAQIYWVCPLVCENEALDIAAATQRQKELTDYFGPCVGLLHGHQDSDERKAEIRKFTQKETSILVATTVIEVGVDVPSANVIIIEHAERFGLSQLHQLRGRVGRGTQQSYCLLLYGKETGHIAKQRLSCLKHTEDGFKIANEDFHLRGSGDATGYKQSGLKDYHFSKDEIDPDLLEIAAIEAQKITFAKQSSATSQTLLERLDISYRILLALFDRNNATNVFDGG